MNVFKKLLGKPVSQGLYILMHFVNQISVIFVKEMRM